MEQGPGAYNLATRTQIKERSGVCVCVSWTNWSDSCSLQSSARKKCFYNHKYNFLSYTIVFQQRLLDTKINNQDTSRCIFISSLIWVMEYCENYHENRTHAICKTQFQLWVFLQRWALQKKLSSTKDWFPSALKLFKMVKRTGWVIILGTQGAGKIMQSYKDNCKKHLFF